MKKPEAYLQQQELHLEMLRQRLEHAGAAVVNKNTVRFQRSAAKLDALSPLKVLSRGYAMVTEGETVVRSVEQIAEGDMLSVSLSDGTVQCRAETVQRRKKRGKKTDL